jgi:hypothetical protein
MLEMWWSESPPAPMGAANAQQERTMKNNAEASICLRMFRIENRLIAKDLV